MRVALLSQKKFGVLLNNFVSTEDTEPELTGEGAFDIIEQARLIDYTEKFYAKQQRLREQLENAESQQEQSEYDMEDQQLAETDRTDLSYFVPAKRIATEKEELQEMEINQGFMTIPEQNQIPIYPETNFIFPQMLKMLAHDRGHIALFSSAKPKAANKLNYYIMDASSILPVLALDLRPDDNVLDLCAAPGGKTLAILQTGLPASLVCIDHAWERTKRLREVLNLYVPPSYIREQVVQVRHCNGIAFASEMENHMKFDKILVNVPCYTDRHVLHSDENNLFQKSRKKERLYVQENQKKLLCAALTCVKPGGTVVYSTCTLSMPQNDGIIQAAVDTIHETTDFKIAVQDTSGIADKFRMTFDFYDKCRYGQLVLPNLTSNFGPTYFCKLTKLPT